MAYSRRSYKGAAVANAIGVSTLVQGATSVTLVAPMSGWTTGDEPFFIVVDPGTAKEEKICVIYNTSTVLTVVDPALTSGWSPNIAGRGADDTIDRQHDVGAVVYPVFTATEANQANELVSKYATNGDIVTHGSTGLKKVSTGGVGNNNKILTADSTLDGGIKWAQIVEASIADSAVTSAKIADLTIVAGDIATGAITSAKILDGTIVADDLADAAVTSPKLAAPTLTAKTDSFTLALVDANCTLQCNKATAMTVTVPTSTIAFAVGAVVTLVNYGAGQVTVAGDTGVTVRSSNGLKLRVQWSMASLVKISDTEWVLSGDTVA